MKKYNLILCMTRRNFLTWNSVATCFTSKNTNRIPVSLLLSFDNFLCASASQRHKDIICNVVERGRIIMQFSLLYCYHLSSPILIFTIYCRLYMNQICNENDCDSSARDIICRRRGKSRENQNYSNRVTPRHYPGQIHGTFANEII